MVDDMTSMEPPASPQAQAPAPSPPEKQGFLSTTIGKVVVIGAAIFAFFVVAGLVATAVFVFWLGGEADEAMDQMSEDLASASTTATASEESADPSVGEPIPVPYSAIFTFRDVFDPLVVPTEQPTATSVSTSTTTTADGTTVTTTEANTLILQDVVVEDGTTTAVLYYEGTQYSLVEGETLQGTPWQVLTIGDSSVVMLYGDTQVTLSVGQGIAK